jgi:putative transcriptional regulator
MNESRIAASNLVGSLLLAHPGLNDPNFTKSVILVSAHSVEDGAMGVILNRPLRKTLGEYDGSLVYSGLADVPVYQGGPVQPDQVILSAWSWSDDKKVFKLFFGIEAEKAQELRDNQNMELRAFLGYSGWGRRQLEGELAANTWVLANINRDVLNGGDGSDLWRSIMGELSADLRLLADVPDDPSLN